MEKIQKKIKEKDFFLMMKKKFYLDLEQERLYIM
jgi:hypothetical protein